MSFKQQLRGKLKNKIPEKELAFLPSGFQKIGDIIILNLPENLQNYKKEIATAVLELFPTIRVVCNKVGAVHGQFREPQVEYLAGDTNTVTVHTESNCKYTFDVTKIMFAKGNLSERTRIPKQVKKNEIIVDMFAGIGYFSIPLAKLSKQKPKKIYSIELNPVSFHFLEENILLNKIDNIKAIQGDNRAVIEGLVKKGVKADRIIMGYLPPPKEFLPSAFEIIKKGGMIHYEDIVSTDTKDEEIKGIMNEINSVAEKYGFTARLVLAKCIKSYGPKVDHYVFDVRVA